MKPWEQVPNLDDCIIRYGDNDGMSMLIRRLDLESSSPLGEREAKLVMAAPDMARLLEKLEHVRLPEMSFSRCPSCLSPCDLSQPHEAGCEWELALRKAGLR